MKVLESLFDFYEKFVGVKGSIGKTEQGEDILYFHVKKSSFPKIIVQYGIHAREYITTLLALEQIKDFNKYGKKGSVYFIPAVNVDGIKICESKYPLYKANYNGVDLNTNFDAKWGSGKFNIRQKASENYIGKFPFSESESRALRDFTLKVMPDLTVSYHSKGEEIYFDFFQPESQMERDRYFAETVADLTGYKIVKGLPSAGGYKDWCVEKLKIPALTLEVGKDSLSHPLKEENLSEIYNKNKRVIFCLTETEKKKWKIRRLKKKK